MKKNVAAFKESFMYLPTLFFTLPRYAWTVRASYQCDDVHYDAALSSRDTMAEWPVRRLM